MPKKRKAAPPPAFTGTILPIDHAVDPGSWTRTGPLRVVRTLDGDAAASEVVLATDETTGEDTVIKAELLSAPSTQVYHDRNVLDWLLRGRGQRECPLEPGWTPPLVGLPRLHKSCESRLIMHTRTDAATGRELPMRLFAMEVLGPSLERALRESPRGLPAAAVRALGRQLLDAMEYIHSNGYLHCDVKPANFLLKGGTAYIVDFGIAKKFVETIYRKPSERDTPGPKFRHSNLGGTGEGTSEWKSCFAERCDPLGRREDMEPLGFVLLKLSTGELPWEAESQEGGAPRSKAEEARVGKARLAKKAQPAAKLCAAIKDGPLRKAVLTMLESARAMGPMDKPDYALLRKLLSSSAADAKAGEKELRRLEAACSGGAAAAGGGAAAASGSPSPPKKKKTAHRRSSGGGASGGARAASPADKKKLATKRMAMAKSLGRAAAQQPAAAAAAAASPQRRKRPSASGKAKAKAKRRASPSPAPAARSENVCDALVDLCDEAKGRVTAAQRTALAEAIEAVDSAAEAGDGRAQAASAVVEEALSDGLEGVKVGELRALGKRLKQALDGDRPSGAAAAAETIDLTEAEEEGAAAAAAAPRRDALRPRSPNRRASSERAQRQCAEPAEAAAAATAGADDAWSVSGVFSAAAGMYRNLTSQ